MSFSAIDNEWILVIPVDTVEVAIRITSDIRERLFLGCLNWIELFVILICKSTIWDHSLICDVIFESIDSEGPLDKLLTIFELWLVPVLNGESDSEVIFIYVVFLANFDIFIVGRDVWVFL